MTKRILLLSVLLISIDTYSQNAKQLLHKSSSKCLTIKSGYYEMEMRIKFMNDKDIRDYGQYKFYFKRLKNDSLYTVAFNSELIDKGEYIRNVMYTGNDYVTYSTKDSSAQIMSKAKWAKILMDQRHNDIFKFYLPFTSKDCTPLPKFSDYTDNKHIFKFIAKEMQNNMLCFHIQMIESPNYDSTEILHVLQTVYDYWINSIDMIPIKYSVSDKVLNSGDTLNEYFSFSLMKYSLNNQGNRNLMPLQLSSIPTYCKIEDYVETNKIELLSTNADAPEWALTSLENKNVSLKDYEGKIILIDFFYKSCYSCMKALPILQSLNNKFKSKGLTIIGIDPIDDENDGIKPFISKNGITYKILLDIKKNVAKHYNVSSYPTIYLLNKQGKIIYANSGFDVTLEGELEDLIKSNL